MNIQSEKAPENRGLVSCAQNDAQSSANADQSTENTVERRQFGKRYRCLFPFLLVASAAAAFVCFENEGGISYLFLILFLLAVQRYIAGKLQPAGELSRYGRFLMVLLVLTGVQLCTTDSDSLHILDFFLLAVLFMVLLQEMFGKTGNSQMQQIAAFMRTLLYPLLYLPDAFSGLVFLRPEKEDHRQEQKKQLVRSIVLGLCVLIPLLLVIVPLLVTADSMFGRMLEDLFSFHLNPIPFLARLFLFLCAFITLTAWWVRFPLKETEEKQQTPAWQKPGPAAAVTILAPITILYLIFCIVSIYYVLLRGTLPDGMTYAEYVHQGFYQLLAVTVINLLLLVTVKVIFARHKIIDLLLFTLSALTYCIILTGACRMILYIKAFDLTFQRIFVLWFYLLLAVFITLLLISILRSGFPLLKTALAVAAVLYLVFAFAHPDALIAEYNLSSSGRTDTAYLAELSLDAAPVLRKEPKVLRECMDDYYYGNYSDGEDEEEKPAPYQFNFAHSRGKRILKNFEENY